VPVRASRARLGEPASPYPQVSDNFHILIRVNLCILLQALARHTNLLNKATQAMKTFLRYAFFGSLFLIPVLAHAQNGCIDSPECPTAILGLVGAAGAALYARLRSK
jgi:XrtJ-associated TM-motif-TM protein